MKTKETQETRNSNRFGEKSLPEMVENPYEKEASPFEPLKEMAYVAVSVPFLVYHFVKTCIPYQKNKEVKA